MDVNLSFIVGTPNWSRYSRYHKGASRVIVIIVSHLIDRGDNRLSYCLGTYIIVYVQRVVFMSALLLSANKMSTKLTSRKVHVI